MFKGLACGLSVALLAGAVGMAELRARARVDATLTAGFFLPARGLAPYTMYGIDPYDPAGINTSLYFPDYTWAKQPDVIVLGGSTAAGSGVPTLEETYFRQAAKLTGLAIETAGYPGYTSAQELILLGTQVLPRRPQHVLVLSGYNDAILGPIDGLAPGRPTNWDAFRLFVDHPGRVSISRTAHALGLRGLAHLYLQWGRPGPASVEEKQQREADTRDERLRIWRTNLTAMGHLCKSAGIPFTFIAQPNGYAVGAQFTAYPYDAIESAYFGGQVWPAFVEQARQTCAAEQIRFLDATAAVAPEHFVDPAHFTPAGHAQLAAVLAAHLQDRAVDSPISP